MTEQPQSGMPPGDVLELELRGRLTEVEDRVRLAARLALAAELGVLALAIALMIMAWRRA